MRTLQREDITRAWALKAWQELQGDVLIYEPFDLTDAELERLAVQTGHGARLWLMNRLRQVRAHGEPIPPPA